MQQVVWLPAHRCIRALDLISSHAGVDANLQPAAFIITLVLRGGVACFTVDALHKFRVMVIVRYAEYPTLKSVPEDRLDRDIAACVAHAIRAIVALRAAQQLLSANICCVMCCACVRALRCCMCGVSVCVALWVFLCAPMCGRTIPRAKLLLCTYDDERLRLANNLARRLREKAQFLHRHQVTVNLHLQSGQSG